MFDPTPVELRWVDLIVLPLIVSVFIAGWLFGRRAEVQRRVDAVLRRETRSRHPSAAPARPTVRLPETLADAAASLQPGTRLSAGPQGMCGLPVPGPLGGKLPCVKPLGHDGECR